MATVQYDRVPLGDNNPYDEPLPSVHKPSALHHCFQAQLGALQWMWRECRTPMVVTWMAVFGGALHTPVVTFFYLKLDMTPVQMGMAGFITTAGSLMLTPIYGWLLDRWSPMGTVTLTYTLCGLGCALRGFATGPDAVYGSAVIMAAGGASSDVMVLALLMSRASDDVRPSVVSAFITQCKVLSLVAKSIYPLWDQMVLAMGVEDELLRFRIVMASCTLPCVAGFLVLICQCITADKLDPPAVPQSEQAADEDSSRRERKGLFGFLVLSMVLFVQGMADSTIRVLTPLFVHRAFEWGAKEYSVMLFLASAASVTAVASQPAISRFFGPFAPPIVCCVVAAACCMVGFGVFVEPTQRGIFGHVAMVATLTASVAMLDPCIRSIAPQYMPERCGGRGFGLMASLTGGGAMVGSLTGPALYQMSVDDGRPGGLPFFVLVVPLVLAAGLLMMMQSSCAAANMVGIETDELTERDEASRPIEQQLAIASDTWTRKDEAGDGMDGHSL